MNRLLTCSAIIVAAISLGVPGHCSTGKTKQAKSSAANPAKKNSTGQPAVFPVFPERSLDPVIANLLSRVAHKPDLLNPAYLKYYLGPPDNQVTQLNEQSSVYYWYDRLRNPKVELHAERDVSTAREADVMVIHLPDARLDMQAVSDALGDGGKKFFDANGHPAAMYSFAPYTSVSFISPQNSFAVTKSVVIYKGPLLPPPSPEDLQIAQDEFVSSLSHLSAKGNWNEVVGLMRQRVQEQPINANARVALAQALSKGGNVHEAVTEYKHAMSLEPGNASLQQQCIAGLHRIHAHVPSGSDARIAKPDGTARPAPVAVGNSPGPGASVPAPSDNAAPATSDPAPF